MQLFMRLDQVKYLILRVHAWDLTRLGLFARLTVNKQ
jgi:hypothetical protein